tara:strand:+ start:1435 stop:1710 length:276 start_codon:yes stop_codon:yes gene_type:complete
MGTDLSEKTFAIVTQKTGRTVINPIATSQLRHLLKIKVNGNNPGSICAGLRSKASQNLSNDFNAPLAKAGLVEKNLSFIDCEKTFNEMERT